MEDGSPATAAVARVERPARALLGWMAPDEARLTLNGRRQDIAATPEQEQRAEAARAAVGARATGLDQAGVEAPAQHELEAYTAALRGDAAAAQLLNSGWRVAIIDLARIVAAQPVIHTDHAEERTAGLDAEDIAALAAASLPITAPPQFPIHFDPGQRSWVLSSANPNLRVISHAIGQTNGAPVIGFMVGLLPSFVRAARYQGRYILVDGYHRSYGFLRRNISAVPALVADVAAFEQLALPQVGMLPQDAYLGERPPMLADYLDDTVAADVSVPATQKTIVIPALEVNAG